MPRPYPIDRTLRSLKRKRKKPEFFPSPRVRRELQRSLAAIRDIPSSPGFLVRDARFVSHLEEETWNAWDLYTLAADLATSDTVRVSILQARSMLLRKLTS